MDAAWMRRASRPVNRESSAGCAVTVSASNLNPLPCFVCTVSPVSVTPKGKASSAESKRTRAPAWFFEMAESTSERTASEGIRTHAKRTSTARAKRT